jgi:hypothetical protein
MSALPFLAVYLSDWFAETQALSTATCGAYIRTLLALHTSQTRGQLTLSAQTWARITGLDLEQTQLAMAEIEATGAFEVIWPDQKPPTDCNAAGNADVTVVCERMQREDLSKEQNRRRVEKYRLRHGRTQLSAPKTMGEGATGNADVTPPGNADVTGRMKNDSIILHSMKGTDSVPEETGRSDGAPDPAKQQARMPTDESQPTVQRQETRGDFLQAVADGCRWDRWFSGPEEQGEMRRAAEQLMAMPGATCEEVRRRGFAWRRRHEGDSLRPARLVADWEGCGS